MEPVAFLDKLPGTITVNPGNDGPETGRIRAIYVANNEPTGDYSPEYPVTLTP